MRPAPHLGAAALAIVVMLGPPGVSAALSPGPPAEAAQSGGLAVIVNQRNPLTSLTLAELRRIFVLETQYWPHGPRITLVLREQGQPARALALRLICNMNENEYRVHLLQETFRGRISTSSLRSIRTAEDMRAFVFNAPNAIGHVAPNEVDGTVKVLRVEGRLPSDAHYPLMGADGWPGVRPPLPPSPREADRSAELVH